MKKNITCHFYCIIIYVMTHLEKYYFCYNIYVYLSLLGVLRRVKGVSLPSLELIAVDGLENPALPGPII